MNGADRKVVLVTRRTRLQELIVRHHTLAQARFYVEHLGADFSDYLREDAAYAAGLATTVSALEARGRYQIVDREYLANFVFGDDDVVMALGQDGLVANTIKYLSGHPLVGINPEPSRWDGVLLPFTPDDVPTVLADVVAHRRPVRMVTMAEARLSDGQVMRAVNDLFIGPRTHTSALYDIALGTRHESQSSSGIIVSTGLGSTAWMRSVVTGSIGIAQALDATHVPPAGSPAESSPVGTRPTGYRPQPWDSRELRFAVREPFVSRSSSAGMIYGAITVDAPLVLRSRMPTSGVIFSDGMENDYLRFTAGIEATIGVAAVQGCLVV